jgi:hypothetical protein
VQRALTDVAHGVLGDGTHVLTAVLATLDSVAEEQVVAVEGEAVEQVVAVEGEAVE